MGGYQGPIQRPFEVWTDFVGWCSACLRVGVETIKFGTRERCVGICGDCLDRLNEERGET
jgi:hypothetical protein